MKINLAAIRQNANKIITECHKHNIDVAGVVKGCGARPEVVEVMIEAGCQWIADSRLERLVKLKKRYPEQSLMMLRIPTPEEAEKIVKTVDISLNSEPGMINSLQKAAKRLGVKHKVILLVELGDLREGIYPADDVINLAWQIEKMEYIELAGLGVNLSCFGGIVPDQNNLGQLVELSEKIESELGRELEIISGGATTSLPLLLDGKMPPRVNQLRLGEAILLNRDLPELWGYNLENTRQDTFILEVELAEVKLKPSRPWGKSFVDAFGQKRKFDDRGERKRAIAAIGRADMVYPEQLIPLQEGIEVLGASSDHLILDIEDYPGELKIGDTLKFGLYYGPLLHLSESPWVNKYL